MSLSHLWERDRVADQIRPPKLPFVGAPPRGEAFQLRIALVRGGAPLLRIRSVDAQLTGIKVRGGFKRPIIAPCHTQKRREPVQVRGVLHMAIAYQHSMIFTARPPRAVSLYLVSMSAPVSRMVLITLSRLT